MHLVIIIIIHLVIIIIIIIVFIITIFFILQFIIIIIKWLSPGSGRSSCFTNFEKLINWIEPVQLLTKGQNEPIIVIDFFLPGMEKSPGNPERSIFRPRWSQNCPDQRKDEQLEEYLRDRDTKILRKLFTKNCRHAPPFKNVSICQIWREHQNHVFRNWVKAF